MNLPLLVVVLPPVDAGTVIGVRSGDDAPFKRPLQTGDSVRVEVILDRAGLAADEGGETAVKVVASVSCGCGETPRVASTAEVSGGLSAAAPENVDPYADDLECVANIPV